MFDWTGGQSGRLLTGEQAATMEKLWAKYPHENKDKADRITMSYVYREKLQEEISLSGIITKSRSCISGCGILRSGSSMTSWS